MDDKCGVFCNLQALLDFRSIKAAFFRNEEIGCLGSNQADLSFFDDCNFAFQFDRRGNSDWITEVGNMPLCSKEFLEAVKPYLTKYKYKTCFGSSTDVATLKRNGLSISTVNISSGYFDPHTDNEIVHVKDINNGYKMVKDIVLNLGHTKFEHVYTPPKTTYSKNYNYKDYDDYSVYADYYAGAFNKSNISLYRNFVYAHRTTPKLFRYVGRDPVDLTHLTCPSCGRKDCLYFLPDALEFYCTTDNVYIHNPGTLFKELSVKDRLHNVSTEIEFVFDWTCFGWYKKHDAVWVKELNTYKLKDK